MSRSAPAWLEDFQRRFGDAIRTPLDRSTGTLTATTDAYDAPLVATMSDGPSAKRGERLAIYNRQYWFRLFSAFHDAYPLTMRLFGAWEMNAHVARFLETNAPRHWDLAHATDGFENFLENAIEDSIVIEAAHIDRAWQSVFLAPPVPKFRPSESDASRLLDARLVKSPALAIVEEHAPLMDLRRRLLREKGETRVETPDRLKKPRFWALVRREDGTMQLPLEPQEAALFDLVTKHPLREALAMLEGACSDEERSSLPEKTRTWLARSVENDFWVGLDLQLQITHE